MSDQSTFELGTAGFGLESALAFGFSEPGGFHRTSIFREARA